MLKNIGDRKIFFIRSLEFPSVHMEFNMLHHASKRNSSARKITCLSSNMGAQPERSSEHRHVSAMFTDLEPPLAHRLHTCSPDSHKRSHPCNSGGTRAPPDRHEIVCEVHFPLLGTDGPFHAATPNAPGINRSCSFGTRFLYHRVAGATHGNCMQRKFCRRSLAHRLHGTNTRPRKQT
jgi:hypothetical protein